MFLNNVFQHVPHFRADAFNLFLSVFNVRSNTFFYELFHDEGLEQFQSHFFRQTTLMHFQLWSDDDNGTAGIVDTLT
ncbi:Uncharacterised protein [uncultured Ruminococcus sp.]|nr:Uncharacterised protein [uncultured Ruminococcus sp.]